MRILALIAIGGCGRIAFDLHEDASAPAGISLSLPAGGQFERVAVGADGTWYALSRNTGAFRSDDRGATWIACERQFGMGIAAHADGTVWLAGPDVLRSTDRCASWQATGSPREAEAIVTVGDGVYALTDIGLQLWNGSTWTPLTTPLDGNRFMAMASNINGLYAGTVGAGLVRSDDGTNWTVVGGLPSPGVAKIAAGTTRTYVITTSGAGGISCGDASGTTFTTCDAQGGLAIAVDPANDSHVVAAIYDDLAETADAFSSPPSMGLRANGMDDAIVTDLVYAGPGELIVATDRGIFVSLGTPLAFQPRLQGLSAWDIDEILAAGDDIYLATRGGVLHASGNTPFTHSTQGIWGNTGVSGLALADDGTLFATGRGIWASNDRGQTWRELHYFTATEGYRGPSVELVGTRAYAGTLTGLLVADAPWSTWSSRLVGGSQRQVRALRHVNGALWAGTVNGLFVSMDAGQTFQPVPALGTSRCNTIYVLADGGFAVGTSTGAWLSDASRTAWQRTSTGNVQGFTEAAGAIVAATDVGIEFTRDRGGTWQPVPGAEAEPSSAVMFEAVTGQLIVGANRGLLRVPLP